MEISRVLRVILTIFIVVTFIVVTVAAYRQNQRVKSMSRLSNATTSLVTRLTSQELVWVDDEGLRHPFVLDLAMLRELEGKYSLPEENLVFRASITYLIDNEQTVLRINEDLSAEKMRCSLFVPTTVRLDGEVVPAKLEVISWFA